MQDKICDLTLKLARQYGVVIAIPTPDPKSARYLPCTYCGLHVAPSETSIFCENCQKWSHSKCTGIGDDYICNNPDAFSEWNCLNCL